MAQQNEARGWCEEQLASVSWVQFVLWVHWSKKHWAQRLWDSQQNCTSYYFGEHDCSPRLIVLAPPPTTWQHHLNSNPWNVSMLSPCMSARVLQIVCSSVNWLDLVGKSKPLHLFLLTSTLIRWLALFPAFFFPLGSRLSWNSQGGHLLPALFM